MLRTSLRNALIAHVNLPIVEFLSSNAQDFIEEETMSRWRASHTEIPEQ